MDSTSSGDSPFVVGISSAITGSAIASVLSIAGVGGMLLVWLAAGALEELNEGDFGLPCSVGKVSFTGV